MKIQLLNERGKWDNTNWEDFNDIRERCPPIKQWIYKGSYLVITYLHNEDIINIYRKV